MSRSSSALVVCFACSLVIADSVGSLSAQTANPPKQPRVDLRGDPLPEAAVARLGTARFRHGGKDLLGFTTDAKSLIYFAGSALYHMDADLGTESKVVRCSDAQPQAVRTFGGRPSVELSGDTKVLAVVSQNGLPGGGSIGVFETATGKERRRIAANDLFKNAKQFFQPDLSLTDDGKLLLVCGSNQDTQLPLVWIDTVTGQRVQEVAPEKEWFFGQAKITRDGQQVVVIEHQVNNNGKGNPAGRLRIFDVARGTEVRAVNLPANKVISFFELRPDGKTLLAYGDDPPGNGGDGQVRLYDFSTGKELKEVRAFSGLSPMGSFVQSRDGKQLFIAGQGLVHHWDIETGKEIRRLVAPILQKNDPFAGFPGRMGLSGSKSLAVSADGKQLAVSGSHSFGLFSVATGKQQAGGGDGAAINVVHFTPDGNGLIVGNNDYVVQQWDVKSAKLTRTLERSNNALALRRPRGFDFTATFLGTAAYSHDGKLLAVGFGENGVGVWDTSTGKFQKLYGADDGKENNPVADGPPTSFAFAPHSNLLATGRSDGSIKLWNTATGGVVRTWTWYTGGRPDGRSEAAVVSMAFSPDGKTLAGGVMVQTGNDLGVPVPQVMVILWETATGKERLRLNSNMKAMGDGGFDLDIILTLLDQMPIAIRFSPDGKSLAISSFSGLHLLDSFSGKDIVSYAGRSIVARTATFSADGKHMFVGRTDGSVRVLETATGRIIRDFQAHAEPVLTLALSPDGAKLASGSNDSTVLLWDVAELSAPPAAVKQTLAAQDLDRLWRELAGDDAAKAYSAMNSLALTQYESVAFLKTQLKTVAPVDPQKLDKLLDDLNSDKFATREKATVALDKLGDLAGPALRQRLAGQPTLETRQRIEKLLAKLNGPVQSPQILQGMRGIEVLERIGTPDAMAVLTELARGAPGHRFTEDAREVVERFGQQAKKN